MVTSQFLSFSFSVHPRTWQSLVLTYVRHPLLSHVDINPLQQPLREDEDHCGLHLYSLTVLSRGVVYSVVIIAFSCASSACGIYPQALQSDLCFYVYFNLSRAGLKIAFVDKNSKPLTKHICCMV